MSAALAMAPRLAVSPTAEPMRWVDVGTIDDVPPLGARRVETPGGEIAIFRTAKDDIFALDNRCPHKGGPLSEGIVHGESVTCPLHNLVLSLIDGTADDPSEGCAKSHPVRVEGGRLLLGLARD